MKYFSVFLSFLASTAAFTMHSLRMPSAHHGHHHGHHHHGHLHMSEPSDSYKLVGDIPPLGYFDPLNFSKEAETVQLKKLREAEIHHGRIAMVSTVVLAFLDAVYDESAINVLRLSDTNIQLFAVWLFAMYEGNRILRLYDSPFSEKTQFQLKSDATPGQYYDTKEYDRTKMEKELSNGRLAMIGAAGYIAQEFVSQQPLF